MSFNIGERVLFLHDSGKGVILDISPDGTFQIEDEDGFRRKVHAGEICKIHSESIPVDTVPDNKLTVTRKNLSGNKTKNRWEIDLHIDTLTDSTSGMTNHEIVQFQMKSLIRFLEEAQLKKVRKILIIHGVGEGVLRREVHDYLRGISGAVFHDEHYTPKGFGATLLELKYAY